MMSTNKVTLSYRHRLLLALGFIWLFLITVLIVTHWLHKATLIDQARSNLAIIGKQVQITMDREIQGMQRRVGLVAQHADLRRQLAQSARLNRVVVSPRVLSDIRSTLLPGQKLVVITRSGDVVAGKRQAMVVDALMKRSSQVKPMDKVFYLPNKNGIERVTTAVIKVGQRYLGLAALTHAIDDQWLRNIGTLSRRQLVMTDNDRVVLTTLDKKYLGNLFAVRDGKGLLDEQDYLAYGLVLDKQGTTSLKLWLLLPQKIVLAPASKRLPVLFLLGLLGAVVILLSGRVLLSSLTDFAASVRQIIKDLRQGEFRATPAYQADDELGYIERQILKLAKTLHAKQNEYGSIQPVMESRTQADPLTRLDNRAQLYDMYPKHLYEARRYQKRLVVVIANIDKLKLINDRYGRSVGDYCIQHVAKLLQRYTRDSDYLFHLDGGEFLILNTGNTDGGLVQAEKIRAKLEQTPLKFKNQLIDVTASFGVAQTGITDDSNNLEALLNRANRAVEIAKSTGNRVAVWNMTVAQAS